MVYYSCIKGADYCNHYVNTGIKKGSCGVECTSDLDCSGDDFCQNYKCRLQPYCGDGSCDSGESCITCSGDCGSCNVNQNDLSSFPMSFFSDYDSVVGVNAPAADTIAVANIAGAISQGCYSTSGCKNPNMNSIFDKDFKGVSGRNVVIVGSIINGVCQNTALTNYGGIDCANSGISSGHGLIKLISGGGNVILIVTGDASGLAKASNVLKSYKNYQLSGSQYIA